MKHVVMLFALLLALGLLTACGKDEPDDYYLTFHQNGYGHHEEKPLITTSYEVEWVMDRQVIDKTIMNVIGNQTIQIEHMPDEVLLRNFSEIQGHSVFDCDYFFFDYKYLAYDDKSLYFGENSSMAFTVDEQSRSIVDYYVASGGEDYTVGPDLEYAVGLDYQIDGTYNQNTDQWTLKWTVSSVSLYEVRLLTMISSYTFDPALTLMLISTKRLN